MNKTILAALAAAAMLAAPAAAQNVTTVAPHTSKVVFENSQIRVVRSAFVPGAAEGVHSHPAGWYLVTKGGTLEVTGADGKTSLWSPKDGDAEWSDGEGAHSARNIGKSPLEYLLVEVKTAPTAYPNR